MWQQMEADVVRETSAIVFVTAETADLVMAKYPSAWRQKVFVVPHGFEGPISPISMILTEIAAEMVLTSQPKARRKGPIMTPGAARTLTPASIDTNTRPSTTQA